MTDVGIQPVGRRWLTLTTLVAIAIVVGTYAYYRYRFSLSLDLDEPASVAYSNAWAVVADDTWPPLYYAFLRSVRLLFGSSEWIMRLPSVLCTLLAGLCVYLGFRSAERRSVALIAAVALTCAPYVIQFSFLARGYSLLLLASGVITVAFTNMWCHGYSRRWMLVFGCAGLVAVGVHHYGTLLVVATYITLSIFRFSAADRRALHHGCLALWALAGPMCAIWVRQLHRGGGAPNAARFIQFEQITKYFGPAVGVPVVPVQFIVGLVLVALVWRGSRAEPARENVDAE